ncbi:carbamate kinase [Acidocella sp.]|uniref:carbamate kinase n=1 Tax=Acidocella sp. TaxID=50710 RepID=UPI00260C5981|nr:carbamate kinase [Acidocella sp.]
MRILVALGGNALLPRGQPLTAAAQQQAADMAARVLAAAISAGHQLIITHGNGPQVGLLALQSSAGPAISALPLDALGAESEGWIGYAIELALRNALPEGAPVVALMTQTLVDLQDPAFAHPTKPIGPVYDEATARRLAREHDWQVAPDGKYWRRVVASPQPLGILEIASILHLARAGITVICGGGGGVPVGRTGNRLVGAEAVIDKDATSALLAEQAGADMLVMLTDVAGVYLDYGTPAQRLIAQTHPAELAAHAAAFPAGSIAPKVRAACAFVARTAKPAAIGALTDFTAIIAGQRGTTIAPA